MNNFSTYNIFAYVPPSAIKGDRLRRFDQNYFLAKLAIYARQLCIFGEKKKNPLLYWIYDKKSLF